jgi:hypothetical protein
LVPLALLAHLAQLVHVVQKVRLGLVVGTVQQDKKVQPVKLGPLVPWAMLDTLDRLDLQAVVDLPGSMVQMVQMVLVAMLDQAGFVDLKVTLVTLDRLVTLAQ